MKACSEPDCAEIAWARGWCRLHYARWYRQHRPPTEPCSVEGCEKIARSRGWCSAHYSQWCKHGDPLVKKHRWDGFDRICDLEGCDSRHFGQGLCKRHYRQAYPERNPNPWNDRRKANYQKRRALKKGALAADPVLLAEIRERDGNRCGICGKRVNGRPYPHPQSASLDHVVPLSHGGAHDSANVQFAHLGCNIRKGNRGGGEQLMLYG